MPTTPQHSPSSAAPPQRGARRVKPWMVLVGISIGWKVLVLTLGAAVPRWVIGDGLDLIPAGSRAFAQQAKVTALGLWDHPLERLGLVQALRVIRVDSAVPRGAVPRGAVPRGVVPRVTRAASAGDVQRSPAAARAATVAPSREAEQGAPATSARCNGRTATVRAYTYFAIPYSEARTVCDSGVVEYRLFRRRS